MIRPRMSVNTPDIMTSQLCRRSHSLFSGMMCERRATVKVRKIMPAFAIAPVMKRNVR